MVGKRIRSAGAAALVACGVSGQAHAQDVAVPRPVITGGAAVAGGIMAAKAGRFCLRHPGLCAVGAIGGLAVGGTAIAMKKRQLEQQGRCAPPGGC